MSYLGFLTQWYNWPYLAALAVTVLSFTPGSLAGHIGQPLASWLKLERVSGRLLARVFSVVVGVLGLTVNGALHDYLAASQERGFLPGLVFTLVVAALVTRSVGRLFERQFPEIKALGWGAADLTGREARVVSKVVSPDYAAGRAQVMDDDGTLHIVLCKAREEEFPYGSLVELGEYDAEDRRYFVERAGEGDERSEGVELYPDP